jgi:hypothetical protein
MDWLHRLTYADRVTFTNIARATCHYRDRDGLAGEIALEDHHPEPSTMSEARLICDLDPETSIAGRLVDAKSVAWVPVRPGNPVGALAAYWRSATEPTIWHLQTMQLLADVVETRVR